MTAFNMPLNCGQGSFARHQLTAPTGDTQEAV